MRHNINRFEKLNFSLKIYIARIFYIISFLTLPIFDLIYPVQKLTKYINKRISYIDQNAYYCSIVKKMCYKTRNTKEIQLNYIMLFKHE